MGDLSTRDKPAVLVSQTDDKSAGARQLANGAETLIEKLRARITPEGPFTEKLFEELAETLRLRGSHLKSDDELITTSQDFADGKLRGSVFAAYVKEALSVRKSEEPFISPPARSSSVVASDQETKTCP